MPGTLNKIALKAGIKAAFLTNLPAPTTPQTNAIDALAGAIADSIDAFVKSGTVEVTVAAAIPVSTTGTAVAQTGVTTDTGTGTGSIS